MFMRILCATYRNSIGVDFIIVQIHVNETKGTLFFASRANRVTNCAQVNKLQLQEIKKLFWKESLLAKSMFSMRRARLPPLPPSFESLLDSEDTMPPLLELDALAQEFQSFPSSGSNIESISQETPPVFLCERKRRTSEKSVEEDLGQQLGELQVQYDSFQLQFKILQHGMRENILEIKELKEELAFTQYAINKARKLDRGASQSEDRRGKSLDGWESDGNVKQMRA